VSQHIHWSQQGVFTSGALSSPQKRQTSPGIGFASIRSYVIDASLSCIAVYLRGCACFPAISFAYRAIVASQRPRSRDQYREEFRRYPGTRQHSAASIYCSGILFPEPEYEELCRAGSAMSTYKKMKTKRDKWKSKALARGRRLRYQIRETRRVKRDRNRYKKAWRDSKRELEALKRQNKTLSVCDKTSLVFLTLQLFVVARIGFRAISRILAVMAPRLGLAKAPCTQTIINWVSRFAIVRMKDDRPPVAVQTGIPLFSNGFILMLDASIGLGKGKIMAVLALDANHYSFNKGAPSLQDVKCVAVSVAGTWTGETIAVFLQKIIARIGNPVAYLKDGGTDLGKAVRLLNEKGLPGLSIDDISHLAANLLKHEYQRHPMFEVFIRACGKVSKMLKQSFLACLAPPKVSTKARFMNLHRLVKWAARLLEHSPRGRAAKGSKLQKLRDRLDQLPQCRQFIKDFLRDVEPILDCQKILKTKGLSQASFDECLPIVDRIPNSYVHSGLRDWLENNLLVAQTLGLQETGMPISSDTIESLFGVAKIHGTGETKDADRIAQRIPVLCGAPTRQDAENVLRITVAEQHAWSCSTPSLTKQRRDVLSDGGCLENIPADDGNQGVEIIVGSKSGQNTGSTPLRSTCYNNDSEP